MLIEYDNYKQYVCSNSIVLSSILFICSVHIITKKKVHGGLVVSKFGIFEHYVKKEYKH